ncbi:hypothetical protein [Streptomyces sp. Ncost-T6T-1]|uniref:hypothetical protein n=1 Tax=Streptomyces sp. Ncost-T6T-1 TaxID=1100828 RepID=UPI001EFA5BBC|nr:hypothetical protein [Streptomyces sp. Ncost-T6T-1]
MINSIPAKRSELLQQLIRLMPEQHFILVEGWWDTAAYFAASPNVTYVPRVYDMGPCTAAIACCWSRPPWKMPSLA